jgi:hypothetical protein
MMLGAYLHGTPGRLPFVGHFRVSKTWDALSFSVAGSIAQRTELSTAFQAARNLESVLHSLNMSEFADRHVLMNSVLTAINSLDLSTLGPDHGQDLCLILVAKDTAGMGIAGLGLGGVWSWANDALQPLVTDTHPLLCGPGLQPRLPGVLTLDEPAHTIVAIPHDHPPQPPRSTALEHLKLACGVHR